LLGAPLAEAIARIALANVQREYPRRLDQLITSADGEWLPRRLHPAFYGSYDWHSSVHMHWSLARLLRLFPSLPQAGSIAAMLDRHLSKQALATEAAFFEGPSGGTFERPYGWAWLLELQAELLRHAEQRWAAALDPLAGGLARRLRDHLEASHYPVRAGSHGNTAFACLLALDYARTVPDAALQAAIGAAARRWYGRDSNAPLAYEPSLDDFLSPALVEALLMKELLPAHEFAAWMTAFLPAGPRALQPPLVRDHADAKQSHLDGLCLSRAWCLRRLGHAELAQRHLDAGLPHISGGDYAGEHWLASFVLLARGERP
jgi:hypothetical protein